MKLLTDIRNYPQRSGTSQAQRQHPDLLGNNVKLDERTITDFISFVQRLSEQLTYYNLNNVKQETWTGFLQNDISFHLAEAASGKADQWQKVWSELMENVEAPGGGQLIDEDYQRYFTWRFSFLYTLIGKLMQAYAYSSLLPAWRTDLQALFTSSHLMTLYFLLEKYYQSAEPLLLPDAGKFSYNDLSLSTKEMLTADLLQYGKETASLLEGSEPFLDNADFIFGTAETVPEKVNAASEYLDEIAAQLVGLQNNVRLVAGKYLTQTLDNFRAHQPHVGLLYAFLKLADEHKNEINGLLLKHLDFYYKEVLQIKPKGWQPAQAFVAFELAKNVADYFLPAGSLLQAGKDAKGKDVFYETLQDITVTNAEVTDIRSFTFLKNQSATQLNIRTPLGWFGRTVANSADGKGALLSPGESWNAFSNTANDRQEIGIAFYSELLWQANAEGQKFELYLKLENSNNYSRAAAFIEECGSIRINTDKEPVTLDLNAEPVSGQLKISFTVSGIKNISKASPNASLIFGNKLESVVASYMDVIEMFQTERIVNLQIFVSDFTVKVNNVETAAGMMDISSAFPAFGSSPKVGSNFTVFSPFLAHKKVTTLKLNIHWANKTERGFSVISHFTGNNNIEEAVSINQMDATLSLITNKEVDFGNSEQIKIELNKGNFGHDTYASDMTEAVLKYQSGTNDEEEQENTFSEIGRRLGIQEYIIKRGGGKFFSPPKPPYTPMVKSLELIGDFKEDLRILGKLYRQMPFGIKKIYPVEAYLIPTFKLSANNSDAAEGELYIGLKNVSVNQVIRLLIAVEESSTNPELQNPEVSWSYLKNNKWEKIEKVGVQDGTNNLIQSGIVSLQLPTVDVATHTLMPANLYWLKAAVPYGFTSAVASIISIQAQAVLAQFTNRSNDEIYLGKNVPAGTISNLFPKQSAIKKVLQPYPSFNGKQKETDSKLYTRTSERLRHKSRGVTAWDFENIILEAFPDIYKVKVLHHACPHLGNSNAIEKIIAKAGYVLVLVLPKTGAQNGVYKPLVSKARLTEIFQFIQPLASSFIRLTVMNPLFETVNIFASVYFITAVKDEAVYNQKLRDDIQHYLSPWAFDSTADPDFGGVIYRNTIIDFLESLPYVDYVERLSFTPITSGTSPESMKAPSPASILISGNMNGVVGKVQTPVSQDSNKPILAFC